MITKVNESLGREPRQKGDPNDLYDSNIINKFPKNQAKNLDDDHQTTNNGSYRIWLNDGKQNPLIQSVKKINNDEYRWSIKTGKSDNNYN